MISVVKQFICNKTQRSTHNILEEATCRGQKSPSMKNQEINENKDSSQKSRGNERDTETWHATQLKMVAMQPTEPELNEFMRYPTQQKQASRLPRQIQGLGRALHQGLQGGQCSKVRHTVCPQGDLFLKQQRPDSAEARVEIKSLGEKKKKKENWQMQDPRSRIPVLGTSMQEKRYSLRYGGRPIGNRN